MCVCVYVFECLSVSVHVFVMCVLCIKSVGLLCLCVNIEV